jgi:hypothetical protein
MAGLWWKANTRPEERCREVAAKNGWLSGLLSFCVSRLKASAATPVLSSLLALLLGAGFLLGQAKPAPLDSEEVLLRMERSNAAREEKLAACQSLRSYLAANSLFRRQARVAVEFRFDAPDTKAFRITQRTGSPAIQKLVIEPLMATERASASLPARRAVDICRRNYAFTFSGFDENARAYLFEVQPRTPNKYLFRGKVWVNGQSFGIQRIEGEPAKSPSFWLKRTHFVHEYAQFGDFWFPVRHRSEAELRLFGRSSLVIEYFDYRWEATSRERKESADRPGSNTSVSFRPACMWPETMVCGHAGVPVGNGIELCTQPPPYAEAPDAVATNYTPRNVRKSGPHRTKPRPSRAMLQCSLR